MWIRLVKSNTIRYFLGRNTFQRCYFFNHVSDDQVFIGSVFHGLWVLQKKAQVYIFLSVLEALPHTLPTNKFPTPAQGPYSCGLISGSNQEQEQKANA